MFPTEPRAQRSHNRPLCGKNCDREAQDLGERGRPFATVALMSGMRQEVRQHGALAVLAARQHGVSMRQLAELGYSNGAVSRAVRSGRLHRALQGVYSVGHAGLTSHGRCMAAVLSCGNGAILSHHTGAWLWGLGGKCPKYPHVTVPARGHRRSGVRIHHSTILETEDWLEVERLPRTSVARTLLDLAGDRNHKGLQRFVDRAERRGLLDVGAIDSLISRAGGHPGRGRLGRAIEIYRDPAFNRARSELLFLDLVKKAGLSRPAMNTSSRAMRSMPTGRRRDSRWKSTAGKDTAQGRLSRATRCG
jgi:hypothetical protein